MIAKNIIEKLDKKQPIYMGIDVHKKTWSICLLYDKIILEQIRMESNFDNLKNYLKNYEGFEIRSVYEASFAGFHLHRQLVSIGIKNIVVGTNKLPVVTGDKVKTDRIDSKKLAVYLAGGLLKAIYIPTEVEIARRQIIRTREQFKTKKTRAILQMKSLLIQHGVDIPNGYLSKDDMDYIAALELPNWIRLCVDKYVEEIKSTIQTLKELEKAYLELSKQEEIKGDIEIIKSIPGMGPLVSTALKLEIGDFKRFSNAKKIAAYLGLTPQEHSSGEHIRRGRITGQGRPWIRAMLIEASWKLITQDLHLRIVFTRIFKQTGSKKKAIVAIARRLITRIYSLIKNGQKYDVRYLIDVAA